MRNLIGFVTRGLSSLRLRLLLLIVLACAPLVALMLHTAGEDRQRAVVAWRQRSQRVMRLAGQQEQGMIASMRQFLLAISESSSVKSLDARNCKAWLDELMAGDPRCSNLGVLTPDGQVLVSSAPTASAGDPGRLSLVRQALATRSFSIGDLSTGSAERQPTVTLGYPVLDASGQPVAVVFAELSLDRLVASSELRAQLARGATWTEFDRKGIILARFPAPEDWVGRRLADLSLLSMALSSPGSVTESADSEGTPTFYAFGSRRSRLASGELCTLLGIPRQNLFAEADRSLRRNLSWLGVAAALALGLGWVGSKLLILQPVGRLAEFTARLAAGDLSARTGAPYGRDELGRLTLAFDQMAQALQDRERERLRASKKLQVLSYRLVGVQEAERRQIARELHDEIGQSLTAAEMNLQAAMRSPGPAALERRLTESIQAVERVLEQVHDLSLNLRPSMLDDLGLEPALRWYTHRQAALTGMRAEFRGTELEERLDPVIETECFRVAQEALTNVVRHARARAVTVELSRQDGHLHLSVRDDGVGFDVGGSRGEAVRGASLGLLSMEERASLAGGGVELNSVPGCGTEVHAWFPLKSPEVPVWALSDE
ncbi:MAG TPA: ATP-binding protein [Candidatus Acidoferrum sp.]|jgi:signal transduction histidine kinase|nr:ATP-binding protein [Candidatus Acidoferrum sp.]